jgi:hypothetical protein
MKLKEIGIAVFETTSAGSIAAVASSLFTPTSDGRPAVIRRTKKKQDKNPSIYEGSAKPEYHNTQVKGKDPIPSKSKPTSGHQSPHPFRGKLVGEGDMEADREAGIKWVDNPDWKRLHEMDLKMVKDFLDHKESVSEQQPDQTATQQVAQRAAQLKTVGGGKASAGMVAKGLDKVSQGGTLPPTLVKAIAPYAKAIMNMMADPKLFTRFKMLMKQANAGESGAAVGGKMGEAVGDSAEPLYDLQDELGLEDNILVDELARYLDVDQIADFVAHFRRHHEMGEGIVGDIAKGAGRLAVKGAGKAAKGAGKLAFKGAKGAGKLAAKGAWAGTKIAGRGAMMGAKALAKAGSKKTTTHLRGGNPPGKIQDSKQLEKAPPGREKQVKALKGKVDNPYAVSWASYNKSKGKK